MKTIFRTALPALALAACCPLTHADLIAFYDFNGSADDVSGNGHDAGFVSATLDVGVEGQAYRFDGIDDYIRIPLDINAAALPQLTMGAWVELDRASASGNFASTQTFISHDNGGYDRTLDQDARGAAGNSFSAFSGSGVLSGAPVVTGQWVFVVARYDQVARTVTLNVDDQQFSATAKTTGAGWTFTDTGTNPSYNSNMQGRIDNVFFFDTALSDAEVEAIRLGGASAIMPSVPEPGSVALMLAGLAALGAAGARTGRARQPSRVRADALR